jgi:ribose transport system permease protein
MSTAQTDREASVTGNTSAKRLRQLREAAVILVFVGMVIGFSIALPGRFPTSTNLKNIFEDAVALSVLGGGLTVVLALGEFDLSFAAVVGVTGALAVGAMNKFHDGAAVAVLAAVVAGGLIGVVNGLIVAYGRVPALIGTLAVGSMATGIELALENNNTVYQGITTGYTSLTTAHVAGVPIEIIYGAMIIALLWAFLSFTTFGRRAYAVGNNEEAARIAGVRTQRVKVGGFVVMGVCGGIAGVVLTSQAASYYPNSGQPYLLPAYAAAFLGLTAVGGRRFNPVATTFGVIFTAVLSTGLSMLNAPPAATSLSEGALLAVAVLLGRPRA